MVEHQEKPGVLSDKTKGIIAGVGGTLALVGVVYAIMKQETPKPTPKAKPLPASPTWDYTAPPVEETAVEVTETETPDGIQFTTVLKDVGMVGSAVHGIAMLQPVAEALIMLL